MNKQIYAVAGVTESDYKAWCKETNRQAYKKENKREFFARLADGRLVRDPYTQKLVRKNRNTKTCS